MSPEIRAKFPKNYRKKFCRIQSDKVVFSSKKISFPVQATLYSVHRELVQYIIQFSY